MMRRAGRAHGLSALLLAAVAVALAALGANVWSHVDSAGRAEAEAAKARREKLLGADTTDVPALIPLIENDRRWTDAELKRVIGDPLVGPKARLHARLALLPVDPAQVAYLREHLQEASPSEATILRGSLSGFRATLIPGLWQDLESAMPGDPRILPVASVLAAYDPDSDHWAGQAGKVAQALVTTAPGSPISWTELMRPEGGRLAGPLAAIFRGQRNLRTVRAATWPPGASSSMPETTRACWLISSWMPIRRLSCDPLPCCLNKLSDSGHAVFLGLSFIEAGHAAG